MSAPITITPPTTYPHDEERPHVCGKCRNPFTNGNPLCVNAGRAE